MLKANLMAMKNRITSFWVGLIPYLVGFIIVMTIIFYGLYRFTNYTKRLDTITTESELHVNGEKFWVEHGSIFLNDKYLMPSVEFLESSDSLILGVTDLDLLPTPFEVRKESGSKRIEIIHKDGGFSVLLLKE